MVKKTIYSQIKNQFRHDTIRNWEMINPILYEGEVGVVIGLNEIGDNLEDKTQKAKIGDGIHPWNDLEWWSFIQGNGSDSNISVDQTYNPESENAQSGIAVAEAIDSLATKNVNEGTLDFRKPDVHCVQLPFAEIHSIETYGIDILEEPEEDTNAVNKCYVDSRIGDIDAALDAIIELQNSIIGGE